LDDCLERNPKPILQEKKKKLCSIYTLCILFPVGANRQHIPGQNRSSALAALRLREPIFASTVEPLFMFSIGQKWLYLLRKVLKSRYGFP
jgi:hypothetical protein